MWSFSIGGLLGILNDTHPDTQGGKVLFVESVTCQTNQEKIFDWTGAIVDSLNALPFRLDELIHKIEVLEAIAPSAKKRKAIHLGSRS